MAINLKSTRDASRDQGLKVLVYGAAGAGKTRLCATAPGNAIILSAEAGLLSLRDVDLPVIEIRAIADVHEAYQFLCSPEGAQFDWVMLDSISEIAEVVLASEKRTSKDPRAAYGELEEQMSGLLRAFRDLPGRNVYMSAKMQYSQDDVGRKKFGPMAPGRQLPQKLPYMFDEVFVLRCEKNPEGQIVRTLQTAPDELYEAKDRSGALDQYEPPDLSSIAAKIVGPQSNESNESQPSAAREPEQATTATTTQGA